MYVHYYTFVIYGVVRFYLLPSYLIEYQFVVHGCYLRNLYGALRLHASFLPSGLSAFSRDQLRLLQSPPETPVAPLRSTLPLLLLVVALVLVLRRRQRWP